MGKNYNIPGYPRHSQYPSVAELINAAPEAMFLLDNNFCIISLNKRVSKYFTRAVIGTSLKELIRNFLPEKKILEIYSREVKYPVTLRYFNREPIDLILSEISSEKGSQSLILGTISKAPKEEESILQKLIDSIPETIYIKDRESNFILANNWVANIIGVDSPKELIGKSDFDFFPKQLANGYYEDEREVVQTGTSLFNKVEKVVIKGKIRWYSTTKIPFRDVEGNITGLIGIGRDITQNVKEQRALIKAKKEAEKADRLKSNFLANLSHEIRTPLNGILGFSQFLKQIPQNPEKTNKYLDIIHTNGRQLLMLINDIIDIAMIESNQISIKKQTFSINRLFFNLSTNFEHQLEQKVRNIELNFSLGRPDGQDLLFSDEFRINQILSNLLSNAIKFTQEGSINYGYNIDKDRVLFFVADSGIGIKLSDQKEIFERFRQADESITRSYGGTGLGLSISKGLVRILGGDMWVDSKVNKGATFYFTIPYA